MNYGFYERDSLHYKVAPTFLHEVDLFEKTRRDLLNEAHSLLSHLVVVHSIVTLPRGILHQDDKFVRATMRAQKRFTSITVCIHYMLNLICVCGQISLDTPLKPAQL